MVSHRQRLLAAARIVKADRQGKQVFFATAEQLFSRAAAYMLEHLAEAHADGKH